MDNALVASCKCSSRHRTHPQENPSRAERVGVWDNALIPGCRRQAAPRMCSVPGLGRSDRVRCSLSKSSKTQGASQAPPAKKSQAGEDGALLLHVELLDRCVLGTCRVSLHNLSRFRHHAPHAGLMCAAISPRAASWQADAAFQGRLLAG